MAAGLQVWNSSGTLTLEITDRLTRILGSVDTGTSDGSTTNAGFLTGSAWFHIMLQSGGAVAAVPPRISISGSTLSWIFDGPSSAQRNPAKIVFGVY